MIDNDGSENPVTLPVGESKVQKQESVTDGSSKTTPRRVWIYLLVGGLIVVVTAVGLSIFPPPAEWVGMGTSRYESQVATETTDRKVDGTITKTTTIQKTDPSKTLWDWMSLLLAPATLASLGFWFQSSQEQAKAAKEEAAKKAEEASKEIVDEQAQVEKDRAEKQAQEERGRAEDRQREDALENYINSISDLLIGKGLSTLVKQTDIKKKTNKMLGIAPPEELLDAGIDVIRARTLSILRRLTDKKDSKRTDAGRKGSILLFLYDTGLIKSQALLSLSDADLTSADLNGADLNHANLRGANLSYADLNRAYLGTANLNRANLNHANLIGANLIGANLSFANLGKANLMSADLSVANLGKANLMSADLSDADLSDADLSDANLGKANLNRADLSDANLNRADLSYADLSGANLIGADLSGANLMSADLSGANLMSADLQDAKELTLTQQQLEGENPPLLCNVTLPKGIKVDPNRDCGKIPQELLKRYPERFENLAEAQALVDKHSKP